MKFVRKILKAYSKHMFKKVVKKSNGEAALIYKGDKIYFKAYSRKAKAITEKCVTDLLEMRIKEEDNFDKDFVLNIILEAMEEANIPVIKVDEETI